MPSYITELAMRVIPAVPANITALDYHSIDIDLNHSLSGEPLVDVSDYDLANESFYARADGLNAPYCKPMRSSLSHVWCRKSIAEKLAAVNDKLRSCGMELFLLDGYRPVDLQQALWDHFIEIAKKTLPNPTAEECRRFVGQYWSDPSAFDKKDCRTWPTHSTGGAVDLTLRRVNGSNLYMGGVFDDTSAISHTRYYEEIDSFESASVEEARRNRRILYWSLVDVGFANYSYEWWHFDLGTQMWVMNRSLIPGAAVVRAYYGVALSWDRP